MENMEEQLPLNSFATFVKEAQGYKKKKTAREKRAEKISKLESDPKHWKFLEDKDYGDPSSLNYKARETFTADFLERLHQFCRSSAEMTPLEFLHRLYIIYDETLGQKI